MADSILDAERKYNPEPSVAGQVGATLKSVFEELKYNPNHSQHSYTPKIVSVEREKTSLEKEIEETARKLGFL